MSNGLEELKKLPDTATIGFRVPLWVKVMYNRLSPEGKALLKDIIINIIQSGQLNINMEQRIINININVNHNEVKPSISVGNVVGDPELTKEYVGTLKEELRKAKEIIKAKNEKLKQLTALLSRIALYAKHGDLTNIKRALAKAGVVVHG